MINKIIGPMSSHSLYFDSLPTINSAHEADLENIFQAVPPAGAEPISNANASLNDSPLLEDLEKVLAKSLKALSFITIPVSEYPISGKFYLALQCFKNTEFLAFTLSKKERLLNFLFFNSFENTNGLFFWEALKQHLERDYGFKSRGIFTLTSLDFEDEETRLKSFAIQHLRSQFGLPNFLCSDEDKTLSKQHFDYAEFLVLSRTLGALSADFMNWPKISKSPNDLHTLTLNLARLGCLTPSCLRILIEVPFEKIQHQAVIFLIVAQCHSPEIWATLPLIPEGLRLEYLPYLGSLSSYSKEDLALFFINLSLIWKANSHWDQDEKIAFLKFFKDFSISEAPFKASFHALGPQEQNYFLSFFIALQRVTPELNWKFLLFHWSPTFIYQTLKGLFPAVPIEPIALFFYVLKQKNWLHPDWFFQIIPRPEKPSYFLENLVCLLDFLKPPYLDRLSYQELCLWQKTAEYLPSEKFIFFLTFSIRMHMEKCHFSNSQELLLKSITVCKSPEINHLLDQLLGCLKVAISSDQRANLFLPILTLLPIAFHPAWFLKVAHEIFTRHFSGEKFYQPEQTRRKVRAALGMEVTSQTSPLVELPFHRMLNYLAKELPGIEAWGVNRPT
jgi:hypothetical protein